MLLFFFTLLVLEAKKKMDRKKERRKQPTAIDVSVNAHGRRECFLRDRSLRIIHEVIFEQCEIHCQAKNRNAFRMSASYPITIFQEKSKLHQVRIYVCML